MKKIKDLTIKVTYIVGLSNIEVPDEVYNELAKAYDEGGDVPEWDDELENANEWLLDNIRQNDAMEWEFDMGEILPKYELGEVVAIAQSYMDVDRFHRKGKNAAYLEYLDSILPELKLYPGWGNKMFVKADLMPHHIKITGIKVERLQDISDEDCLKEGIIHVSTFLGQKIYHTPHVNGSYLSTNVAQEAFAYLIDKVSGKGTWESNPFVFAYEFVLFD